MQGKRRDIQGLRAVAVMLVIANHLVGWPSGGFIGVDVFFVLSGFLITGLLVREHERSGRISLKAFYARRARRILPAALTVSAVTVVVAYVLFTFGRFQAILVDAVWATLFGANWRMISSGTNYMEATGALSPIQHFWSLSIEEQFYFVWPVALVMLLAWAPVGRGLRATGACIGLVTLASFAWAMWETGTQPTSAYFSTFSRVWELGAGAFLAVLAPQIRIRERLRPVLSWVGMSVIAASAVFLTAESPFPGPFALLPVLGALMLILAGVNGEPRFLWPLTNKVTNYLGDISYSLYLWHLPVIVFTAVFLEGTPRRFVVVALVIMFGLSISTYHLVENPIRFRIRRARLWKPAVGVVAISAACLLVTATVPVPSTQAVQAVVRVYPDTPAGVVKKEVDAALATAEWPELSPTLDQLGPDHLAPEWVRDGCLGGDTSTYPDPIENSKHCSYGDGEKLAVVFGDSVAMSWVPGVRAALQPSGYRVEVLTLRGCPTAAVDLIPVDDSGDSAECSKFREWALHRIQEVEPELVITSEASWSLTRLASGNTGADAEAEWAQGARQTLAALQELADRVVLLQNPPMGNAGVGFSSCATRGSAPVDCLMYLAPSAELMHAADTEAAFGLSSTTYVQTRQWFCSPEDFCPSFVGSTPVLVDGTHLTALRSVELAEVLSSVLLPE